MTWTPIAPFAAGEVLPAAKLEGLRGNVDHLRDRVVRPTTQSWNVGFPATTPTATGSATVFTTLASASIAFPAGRFLMVYEGAGYASATVAHTLRVLIGGTPVLDGVRADLRSEVFNFPWTKTFAYGRSSPGTDLVEIQGRPASGTATYDVTSIGLRIIYLGYFGDV